MGFNNRSSHSIKKETLFGFGQHFGQTNCDRCGCLIIRSSGPQRYCGPYWDKNSCAYKTKQEKDKESYRRKIYGGKDIKPIIIYNTSGVPSEVHLCECGRRFIKTRLNQTKCLFCHKYH